MRESLGSSMLLNLVIIFAGLVMIFFVGILSYSKAYRVKNRIIEIIEKYENYEVFDSFGKNIVTEELNSDLLNAGYKASQVTDCSKIETSLETKYTTNLDNLNKYGYNYCVFKVNNSENSTGKHYVVVTFVHFEFPAIGNVLTFPVYGETKILGKTYNY